MILIGDDVCVLGDFSDDQRQLKCFAIGTVVYLYCMMNLPGTAHDQVSMPRDVWMHLHRTGVDVGIDIGNGEYTIQLPRTIDALNGSTIGCDVYHVWFGGPIQVDVVSNLANEFQ